MADAARAARGGSSTRSMPPWIREAPGGQVALQHQEQQLGQQQPEEHPKVRQQQQEVEQQQQRQRRQQEVQQHQHQHQHQQWEEAQQGGWHVLHPGLPQLRSWHAMPGLRGLQGKAVTPSRGPGPASPGRSVSCVVSASRRVFVGRRHSTSRSARPMTQATHPAAERPAADRDCQQERVSLAARAKPLSLLNDTEPADGEIGVLSFLPGYYTGKDIDPKLNRPREQLFQHVERSLQLAAAEDFCARMQTQIVAGTKGTNSIRGGSSLKCGSWLCMPLTTGKPCPTALALE